MNTAHPTRPPPKAKAGEVLLSVQALAVAYGGIRAIKKVELEVKRGEIVAMIGDNASSATVSRWSAQGASIGTFALQGFNLNAENTYAANRGVVVAGKYYLTYSNGMLSAWDATGKRVSSSKLNQAGTSFEVVSIFKGFQKVVCD